MTQGLNQVVQTVQNSQGRRCSSRRPKPPLSSFGKYYNPTYTLRQYSYTDNNTRYQGNMGNRMEVILLPRAFDNLGSAPRANELEPITSFLRSHYPIYNFIKGHMWNQEIGGQGVTQNLVPLTSQANSAHKNNVETQLKQALRDFANFYIDNKDSSHPDYDIVYGFQYLVEIQKERWPTVTEVFVPNAIYVQIFPIKMDPQKKISNDNSIINNVVSQVTKDTINRLVSGIWIDQDGDKWIMQNGSWTRF